MLLRAVVCDWKAASTIMLSSAFPTHISRGEDAFFPSWTENALTLDSVDHRAGPALDCISVLWRSLAALMSLLFVTNNLNSSVSSRIL